MNQPTATPLAAEIDHWAALREVERRVLWLSTAMIDHANRVRPNPSGLKVGGHQASSASMATIMTALWFDCLTPDDRVSVKPHASPILHAINYLLGDLDERYLTTLRSFGGLQSYPSRSKDPDPVDYSTGSVGIGATAPIWGAIARRYTNTLPAKGSSGAVPAKGSPGRSGSPGGVTPGGVTPGGVTVTSADRPLSSASPGGRAGHGRQYSLVGDAELDEGACWEAILDPMVASLGEVCWIVDLNRQSLDRVVPHVAAGRLRAMFEAAGWQVLTAKYGHLLTELFTRSGGDALRRRLDDMPNAEYQRLLRCPPRDLRRRLSCEVPENRPEALIRPSRSAGADGWEGGGVAGRPECTGGSLAGLLGELDDETLAAAFRDLGGHDLRTMRETLAAIDDTRPTVVFAYTVKGYGLATEGHPQNHSSMLTEAQLRELAARCETSLEAPWARFAEGSPAAELCARAKIRLSRTPANPTPPPKVPPDLGRTQNGTVSTQAGLGRTLLDLTRQAPEVARRVVTAAPDVASSTNLGGWINKVGVWSAGDRRDWFDDDPETILHWRERPDGQHIELGIAEVNLVGLLGELGATWSRWGEPLLPIGVLYDPFVERALEPWSFGMYAGGQSILVGTPAGVTLAAEGGAHQSITTPSIGLEQPGCISYEPAFVTDLQWTLLAALGRLGQTGGSSAYLRLSSRPVDQALAAVPADPAARERRRKQVVGGAYVIRKAVDRPVLTIAAMGALLPEALAAADRLAAQGVPADVVCVTSPGLLFRALQARDGQGDGESWILGAAFPGERAAPLLTVLDGHPHTLAFLASVHRLPARHLGVSGFGQSGDLEAVYRYHGIDTDSLVSASLDLT